jgi:hypothetical protein
VGNSEGEAWDQVEIMFGRAEERALVESAQWPGPVAGVPLLWQPWMLAEDVETMAFDLGVPSWYDQLVAEGRPTTGLPLLGLRGYQPPPANGSTGSVSVRQVQGDIYGWSIYDAVPYILGCGSPASPDSGTFSECGAGQTSLVPLVPVRLSSSVEEEITLHHISGMSLDSLLALLSNDLLLPGQVPSYGSREPWLLRCRSGSSWAACSTDSDADTHPDAGDCAPSNGTIHPEVDPRNPSGGLGLEYNTTIDLNCDAWPRPL